MADAPNEAEQIATLVALTGVAPAQAVDLLQNAGGDLQLAINDYFIQMEGGDPNAAPPPGGGGDEDAMADDDGGGSHDDDDDDDDFEDDAGGLLSPYSPQGQNALTPPPPPKRPKVEMRQPPKLSTATDELKGQLQRVFGLTSAPVDAAEKLHRAVSDRMQSWAFGDERSLTYLLNCFGRLGAAFPTAAQAIANASGGTGGAVSPQIAQAEADCFPLAVLLHHARAILLSGEAHDDGLGLFQEGGASDSELSRILGSGQPHAPPFVTAIHRSMSEAELEQVYSAPLDDMLSKLASATIKINSGGGGGFGGFGGSSSSSNSGGGGGIDWRKALQEAETLLGLQWVSQPSRQLKALPQGEAIRRVLGKRMAEETSHLRSNRWCARDAETQGCLRLFSPSPPGVDVRSAASRGLKIGAIHHNDGSLMMGVQKEVAQMQSHLRQLLTTALIKDKETQPVLLAWMSAVLQANELHLKPPKDPQAMQQAVMKRAGDACMVNLAAVLLQLCEPFIEPSATKTGKGHNGYERFDVSWFDRELSRRVGNSKAVSMFKSHTLRRMLEAAGAAASGGGEAPTKQEAVDVSDGQTTAAAAEDELAQALRLSLASTTPSPVPTPPATVTSPAVTSATTTFPDFHFVTECFFLAMGAAHSGLLPALDKSERLLQDFHRKARIPPLPENANPNEYQSQLQAIQAAGLGPIQAAILGYKCLTDGEGITNLHGRFAYLTTAWLTHIASLPKADETFTRLPEHAVTNACALVRNMAFTSPQALRMSPWAMPVVSRFLCEMLVRKDLISSPFVRYQFVDALHALAFIDEDMERRQRTSLMLSSNLFDLVDGKAAAAAQPALISLYVELGMHTNADAVTDKNQQRSWLMKVLGRLWLQPQGWAALQALAESDSFGEFATTLVKENIFLLDDALGRLTDVKKAEEEKADTDAWAKLTPRQQADREKRILSVRHTAQAFLGLGKLTLATLLRLATDSVIGKIFTDYPDRAKKMVAMLIKFLTTLTTNPSELNVKDRDKLGWKPRELLSDTTQLLLACYERSSDFLDKLKANDSFERGTVEHVYRILRDKCQKEFPPHKLEKLTTLLVKLGSSEGGEGEGSGSAAAAGEGEKSVTENALMAMKAAEEKEGAKELLARVDGVYQAAMRPLAFGEAELSGAAAFGGGAGSSSSREGQYAHHYNTNIQENPAEGMARTKLKRLMRELGKLGQSGEDGEGALPVNAEASVFMVRDENRMDVLKCLISGPADVLGPSETPYAGGLFEFHVFIPPDYPQVSPLVNLQTTGDGTFRFNPNLYSDGKVCLSLLGTWHGEGWVVPTAGNANSGSTILQVLVSIQSIIMVSKPYFNEPGYEASAGTPAGEERSRDYNENIRLHTMRHAMRDVLRRPPYGMESVVRKHFLLTKPLLERQLARWLDECKDGSRKKGMERAYVEIMDLLVKAEEEEKKAEGEVGGGEAMEIS